MWIFINKMLKKTLLMGFLGNIFFVVIFFPQKQKPKYGLSNNIVGQKNDDFIFRKNVKITWSLWSD